MLWDGHAVYTPGLSENRGGVSAYYSNDRLGNLWTLDGISKNQLTYEDNAGFGGLTAGGSGGSPFGFGGGNGCQTDVDLGLVLMGHRYYDPRIGRFISQDPIGDGDNWYQYAGNSPTNEIDPTGLSTPLYNNLGVGGGQDGTGEMFIGDAEGVAVLQQAFEDAHGLAGFNGYWTHGEPDSIQQSTGLPARENGDLVTEWVPGMIAASPILPGGLPGPLGTLYRPDFKEKPFPDMHIVHSGGDTNITFKGGYKRGRHDGKKLFPLPKKLRKPYKKIIRDFMKKAARYAEGEADEFGEKFGKSQLNGAGAGEAAEEQAAME